MRIAILHDYLNQLGGAERTLEALLEIFPDADLYTLLYDKNKTEKLFERKVTKTSILDRPSVTSRHRLFIPLMPIASKLLRSKKEYDYVISSTAGYAKGFGIKGKFHVSYCYTPLRYAWEVNYLKTQPYAPSALTSKVAKPIALYLRHWDKKASENVNFFITISQFIRDKVKTYYGRDSEVIYPPVDEKKFFLEPESKNQGEYYLMVGRLLYYKRFDLGIKAFSKLGKKLKIVGRGPESSRLKKIANPKNIEFISSATDSELRNIYKNAKALIFPQVEDFGLVAAEAQMCGTPVIAYKAGGALEIVENGKTGLFFNEQTPEAIIEAVNKSEQISFNRNYVSASTERFSKKHFQAKIKGMITRIMNHES